MKYYVGITDSRWFHFLKDLAPDEANFWRPSARTVFRAIPPGALFLFKLHKPVHCIVGGGYFAGYSRIPMSMVWDAFGQKNGAATFSEFRALIANYRVKHGLDTVDPEIGCIALSAPFFFDEVDWIPAPSDWPANLVQGKTFETLGGEGARVWSEVEERLNAGDPGNSRTFVRETATVYGTPHLSKTRLGQGAFRALTMQNFGHKCCVTGETTVPVLEAAHIMPVAQQGNHALTNGLLLRADIHILFDRGLIGIDSNYQIRISPQIAEQFLNGKAYYCHEGQRIKSLPENPEFQPDKALLAWHMSNRFQSGNP